MNRCIPFVFVVAAFLVAPSLVSASDGWVALFDGRTLSGWTMVNGDPVARGWEVVDGMLHLSTAHGRTGDIVTDRDYGDFDLRFQWKIVSGANSGIKYRVRSYGGRTLGCEYQIIDDENYPGRLHPEQLTGALYDLYAPNVPTVLNPPGQFNDGRIRVQGNRIEHWLNGRKIVEARVGGDEWQRRIAESKFADVEGFGENRFGKIMLTDHGDEVWYRNVYLKPLPSPDEMLAAADAAGQCDSYFGKSVLRSGPLGHGVLSRVVCRFRRSWHPFRCRLR